MKLIAHGGVGSPRDKDKKVERAVKKGFKEEMSAFQAVIAVVERLENDPSFNAGTGSKLRLDGSVQMDAAVQSQENVGAVACIEQIKNPIRAAEIVHDSPYVLLVGEPATDIAEKNDLKKGELITEKRKKELEEKREKLKGSKMKDIKDLYEKSQGGTVGCVAYEKGKAAAAVSTGGTSYCIRGRVGDSPLHGAGFYVGKNGAVVATGKGEEIIKQLSSKKCHDLIREHGIEQACKITVDDFPEDHSLGLIAVNEERTASADNREMARGVLE